MFKQNFLISKFIFKNFQYIFVSTKTKKYVYINYFISFRNSKTMQKSSCNWISFRFNISYIFFCILICIYKINSRTLQYQNTTIMKAITLENRIAKSNNTNGSTPNNDKYKTALKVLVSNGGKVHFNYTTGSGRYTKIANKNPHDYLTAWGIAFEYGNDAPRGGQLGEFIQLTAKGKRQCKEYYSEQLLEFEVSQKWHAEVEAKIKAEKEAEEHEVKNLAALIQPIKGEEIDTTAGRLKVALTENGKYLDKKTFWKVVKLIRKNK